MTTSAIKPRVTSFAPQFLVDDLERSMAYYQRIGFTFDEPWNGFYAIGHLDGVELHLKEAPKNQAERRHRRDTSSSGLGSPPSTSLLSLFPAKALSLNWRGSPRHRLRMS